jgi:hypothetical protein
VQLFHGTNGKNLGSIKQGGLRVSRDGRLGPGIYFTPNRDHAATISRHRCTAAEPCAAVFECNVVLEKNRQYDFDNGTPTANGWKEKKSKLWPFYGFDSATGMHSPWAGVPVSFKEVCIGDAGSVRISEYAVTTHGFVDRKEKCSGILQCGCTNLACQDNDGYCTTSCTTCKDALEGT